MSAFSFPCNLSLILNCLLPPSPSLPLARILIALYRIEKNSFEKVSGKRIQTQLDTKLLS